jgi:hypothetical protein
VKWHPSYVTLICYLAHFFAQNLTCGFEDELEAGYNVDLTCIPAFTSENDAFFEYHA